MKALDGIIKNFGSSKDGLTHRRAFLHSANSTSHDNWFNRRRHG